MDQNPKPGQGATFDPKPQTKTPGDSPKTAEAEGSVTLTKEQFDTLIKRLEQGNAESRSPSPSMSGLQTNALGQVVGTITKYSISPEDYPSPIEDLLDDFEKDPRMRRFNLRDNYFISWDINTKPYQTKDGLSVQEPTFQVTIYEHMFDDQGNETDDFIVRKTLLFNEDQELVNMFASEEGLTLEPETMKDLFAKVRYQRIRNWMINEYFYPPRIYKSTNDAGEIAVDGQVVKLITKSGVKGWDKTPVITEEELA